MELNYRFSPKRVYSISIYQNIFVKMLGMNLLEYLIAGIFFFLGLNNVQAQDLYWVGGTGTWDDINHWSTTSGGSGGAALPSSSNNVYFDVNSGLNSSSVISILPGSYDMKDFEVLDQTLDFTFFF